MRLMMVGRSMSYDCDTHFEADCTALYRCIHHPSFSTQDHESHTPIFSNAATIYSSTTMAQFLRVQDYYIIAPKIIHVKRDQKDLEQEAAHFSLTQAYTNQHRPVSILMFFPPVKTYRPTADPL